MYTNDLNNAYLYETQRRMDEMTDATNCHLASECALTGGNKSSFTKHIQSLLLALIIFFVKR